jgi:hypothetical protein
VAYFPSEILLKYCSFRWHASAEKNPLDNCLYGAHTSPKKTTVIRHFRSAYQRAKKKPRKFAWFFIREKEPWKYGTFRGKKMADLLDCSAAAAELARKCYYGSGVTDTSNGNVQVYYGNLTSQIRAVKIFSLLLSVTGLALQPILIQQVPTLGTPTVVAMFGFLGFFTFVTPVSLHMITKKYVTHIYFDSSTGNYSAICLTFLLREKKVIA